MADLLSFEEPGNLVYYINAATSETTTTGTVLNTVTSSVLNPEWGDATFADVESSGQVQHNPGSIKIGQMDAFLAASTGAKCRFEDTAAFEMAGDQTFVAIYEPTDNTVDYGQVFAGRSDAPNNAWADVHGSGGRIYSSIGGSTKNHAACPAGPVVVIGTWRKSDFLAEFYYNDTLGEAYTDRTSTRSLAVATLFDHYSSVSPYQGKLALYALYNSYFDRATATDVYNLCQTWINTGEAPSPPVEALDGEFRANTNDDPSATLSWEWAPLEVDPEAELSWVPALGAGGLSNAEYGMTTKQNDTLKIKAGVVADNGWVRCAATAPYMDGPVYSKIARLTVEASS